MRGSIITQRAKIDFFDASQDLSFPIGAIETARFTFGLLGSGHFNGTIGALINQLKNLLINRINL
jgi:hypothetical protein